MMNDKISSEIVANCKLQVATSNNVCNNEFIGIHQFYGKVLICKHKMVWLHKMDRTRSCWWGAINPFQLQIDA